MSVVDVGDDEIVVLNNRADGVIDLSLSLADAGTFLEVVAALAAIGMIALGVAFVLVTHHDSSGGVQHPLRWPGIGLISGGVVGGVFYWAVARTIRLFARFAAANVHALVYVVDLLSEESLPNLDE